MARKPRDYKAEERRRNERARQAGFTSRAQQRRQIEKGIIPALAPTRLRKESTIKAQRSLAERLGINRGGPLKPPPLGTTFASLAASISIQEENEDWSQIHAGTVMSQYDPAVDDSHKNIRRKDGTKPDWVDHADLTQLAKQRWIKKHGRSAYDKAYYEAFVNSPGKYKLVRYTGGSEELRLWLVEITEYFSADEYESRYGRN